MTTRISAFLRAGAKITSGAGVMLAVGLHAPEAAACGGCFHPKAEVGSSVVTDHRMVFKISRRETVLWDQVRYTGSPQEFAWVLPVRDGAKIELSRDGFIGALDATTRSTTTGPERSCSNGRAGGGGGGGGGGCGAATYAAADPDQSRSGGGFADAGFAGNGSVSVLAQSVIGPYQAVTLRAKQGQGIAEWLVDNDFAIPDAVRPTVDAYTKEGFDFIALRLRPGQGVQSMRPVRVVTAGADTTLPLRMVAAGVGAKVGLTLWVLGEGRYETQNFPSGIVDDERLVWDGAQSKSNLADLQAELLAANDGRTWVVESSKRAEITTGAFNPLEPSLSSAYRSTCITRPPETVPCDEDELPPPNASPPTNEPTRDGGTSAVDAGSSSDGGIEADAGTSGSPAETCTKVVRGCDGFDDLDVVSRDISGSELWVTRLRADLPVAALATDLKLRAAAQVAVSAQHHTETFSDPSFNPCAGVNGNGASTTDDDVAGCACRASRPDGGTVGSWLVIGITGALASRVARRRRR